MEEFAKSCLLYALDIYEHRRLAGAGKGKSILAAIAAWDWKNESRMRSATIASIPSGCYTIEGHEWVEGESQFGAPTWNCPRCGARYWQRPKPKSYKVVRVELPPETGQVFEFDSIDDVQRSAERMLKSGTKRVIIDQQ